MSVRDKFEMNSQQLRDEAAKRDEFRRQRDALRKLRAGQLKASLESDAGWLLVKGFTITHDEARIAVTNARFQIACEVDHDGMRISVIDLTARPVPAEIRHLTHYSKTAEDVENTLADLVRTLSDDVAPAGRKNWYRPGSL